MYLKQEKLVTKLDLPSLMTSKTHDISKTRDVNGAATDASASEEKSQHLLLLMPHSHLHHHHKIQLYNQFL